MFRSSEHRPDDQQGASPERLASRLHVLGERVDTLAQTVATTAAAIAKKDGELVVIRRELEGSQARIEHALAEARPAASDDLRRLEDRVAALATERERTTDQRRIDQLDVKVAQLGERIDTLAATVAATAAGLAGREGDVVALRRRVEQVAGGSGGGKGVDDVLRERIDDLGTATASFSMRVESQAEQISSLRDTVEALAQRLGRAEHERASLAASVAEAAATRWRELERMLAGLADRLTAIEAGRTQQEATLTRAATLWPAALRSLEARVAELSHASGSRAPAVTPSPADQPVADVGRFLAEIRTLERRVVEADAHARHEYDELGARVRRLESERLGETAAPTPVGGDVLPFRGPEN